jgi:UDP-glucose:(heptosyl)LPS alpha-1,3-glucosyltransferase
MNRKHSQILRLERSVFDSSRTKAVIANSHMVREEILFRFPFPADRVHVVYNGISSFGQLPDRAESRKKWQIADDTFCPLFLGTGWDRKGLATAIRAVEMMEETNLIVAGRGPADLFRSDKARFLGPVSDIASLFSAADILVLPTWYDPFSNACLEALAAGLPVITSTANGFAEIITPGIHGEVIPPGDAHAVAEALEHWRAPSRCAEAKTACLKLAADFSIERNARETLAILEKLTTPSR